MNDTMHRIVFEPMGLSIRVPKGTTLFEAAGMLGISLRSDCGGKGRCGKCVVQANSEDGLISTTDAENRLLGEAKATAGHHLACQTSIIGPVRMRVSQENLDTGSAAGKTDIDAAFTLDLAVQRIRVACDQIRPRAKGEPLPDRASLVASSCSAPTPSLIVFPMRDFRSFLVYNPYIFEPEACWVLPCIAGSSE